MKAWGPVLGTVITVLSIGVAPASASPANDNAASAAVIAEVPFSTAVDTMGSTLELNEPQSRCGGIAGSVWYSLTSAEAINLTARLSGRKGSTVAVFRSNEAGLQEQTCAGIEGDAEFRAEAGSTFLIQVGVPAGRRGMVDLSLTPSRWQQRSIVEQTFTRQSDETHLPIAELHGRPRAANPSMYDVTVRAAERTSNFGILTFGLVREEVDIDLLRLPPSTTSVTVNVTARYDATQYTCALDDSSGQCYAAVPISDLSWPSSSESSKAELVVTLSATRNGTVLVERTLVVPFVGQVAGLLP